VSKKTVKLKYVDFPFFGAKSNAGDSIEVENFFITKAIKENYDIEWSDKPDFLLCGYVGTDFAKYNCVKIYFGLEPIHPNFNAYDYALGCMNNYETGNRFLRIIPPIMFDRLKPVYDAIFTRDKFTIDDLRKKTGFCSRVVTHRGGNSFRHEFFERLSKYKKVSSGGGWGNNIGYKVADKFEFDKQHKFSLAFDNSTDHISEKLYDAFGAHTVPIYWGNNEITKYFNPKAFVNFYDYGGVEEVIDRIKEIDHNDDLYLQMMHEPALVNPRTYEQLQKELESFFIHIFETPLEETVSSKNSYRGRYGYQKIEYYGRRVLYRKEKIRSIFSKIYAPFRIMEHFKVIRKIKLMVKFVLRISE
jgi:hypothetical protein